MCVCLCFVCACAGIYTNLSVFFSFHTAPVGGLFENKDYGPYISPLPYQYWGGIFINCVNMYFFLFNWQNKLTNKKKSSGMPFV